jgi:Ran GTPase-activating protein (RanGAP) involved in mRNA processing and transport
VALLLASHLALLLAFILRSAFAASQPLIPTPAAMTLLNCAAADAAVDQASTVDPERRKTKDRDERLAPKSVDLQALQEIASRVRKTPSLTRLELRDCQLFNSSSVSLLKSILRSSPRVHAVDLSWVGLGDEAAADLFQSLQNSTSVRELILSGNDLGESCDYLGEFLRVNKSVVKLHLGSNSLSPSAALSLARGLRENTTLEELDLWNCNLGDESGAEILEAVRRAKSLKLLRLNMNKLKRSSLEAVVRLLQTPTALATLNLDSNPHLFGSDDATEDAFVHALELNKNLRSLGIPYTGVNDYSAKLFFRALTRNNTLEYLDIGYNAIFKDGYGTMLACIPQMKAIQHLRTHARAQLITPAGLRDAIDQNTSLQQFTSICVGCKQVWARLKRNRLLARAKSIVSSDSPLSLLPKAMHRLGPEKDAGASATFLLLERYFRSE